MYVQYIIDYIRFGLFGGWNTATAECDRVSCWRLKLKWCRCYLQWRSDELNGYWTPDSTDQTLNQPHVHHSSTYTTHTYTGHVQQLVLPQYFFSPLVKLADRAIYFTFRNLFIFKTFFNLRTIISGSTGPIFTTFFHTMINIFAWMWTIRTSFSDSSRDVAPAVNFSAKFGYMRSFGKVAFENGLQYRHSDSQILRGNVLSTFCANMMKIYPVTQKLQV